MLRNVSTLMVIAILLTCGSVASAEVLIAAAEPAADGQRAIFKVVNASRPVCLAVFQANDAGSLLTLTTYYLRTLQTIQAAPPLILHYKTTSFFALFEPSGASNSACMSIPTSFLSDPTRAPKIYETLAGGDGPPVSIVQLAGALNIAQQNCTANAFVTNSPAFGGNGGNAGNATGGNASAPGGTATGGNANAAGGTATGGNASAAGGTATGGNATAAGTATATGGPATATGGTASGGPANASGGTATGGPASANGGPATAGNASTTAGNGGNGVVSISLTGNCTGNKSNTQNSTILQNATAIVTFGFEEIDFQPADDTGLTSALMNCSAPYFQTAGSSMTVNCKLPTVAGTFSDQSFH